MFRLLALFLVVAGSAGLAADEGDSPISAERRARNTAAIREFLRLQTGRIADNALADVETLEDWQRLRPVLRQQMFEMLGLWPLPERTPLQATTTGSVEAEGIVVEKLHFQSRPGLYVTANFYRPKEIPDGERLPTILYLCGHARVKEEDVAFGNKVAYQHHPGWFARHGYCSLVIDTLQLGEIEGVHHGTYREGRWWWHARGYTPAGVEAWNSIRALDYLETRPEVDMARIGVTGRSGGGTGTWWLAALDDRPACLVPVAGIVDYTSHVVDGCITGHCDCNYFPNRYGIDATVYAALAAPRPLLLSNTDKDRIFPLDGVMRVHSHLARIYGLYDAEEKLGLLITEGPHEDTQELRVPAFKWMNRWLRKTDEPITAVAEKFFEKEALRTFPPGGEPEDELNTSIDETFVPRAEVPPVPKSLEEWTRLREKLLADLEAWSFSRCPTGEQPLDLKLVGRHAAGGLELLHYECGSEENLRLPIYVLRTADATTPTSVLVDVVDDARWNRWRTALAPAFGAIDDLGYGLDAGDPAALDEVRRRVEERGAIAIVPTRGIGPNGWTTDPREALHLERRFYVLGRTPDEGRVWDVRRAIRAVHPVLESSVTTPEIVVRGEGRLAGVALYAGLFEPSVAQFELHDLPASHREGPILIDVLRVLDLPQAVALAYPRPVVLSGAREEAWSWPREVGTLYGDNPLRFEKERD